MKKRASVIAASVLLFFTSMLWCSCKKEDVAKDQPSTFATINGTVRDLDNGEPLSDVLLTLSPGGLNAYSDDVVLLSSGKSRLGNTCSWLRRMAIKPTVKYSA